MKLKFFLPGQGKPFLFPSEARSKSFLFCFNFFSSEQNPKDFADT